jgi:sRNA-binding carbon storage regulator CsrA
METEKKKEANGWLVLVVKDGETVKIGEEIKIVVKKQSISRHKLIINAPKGIKILREKLED